VAEEKPFDPSDKKIRKATEEGKTPKSKLLSWIAAVCVILLRLEALVPTQPLVDLGAGMPEESLMQFVSATLRSAFQWTAITLGLSSLVAISVSLLQTRFALALKAVTFKVESLSPVSGVQRAWRELTQVHWYLIALITLVVLTSYFALTLVVNSGSLFMTTPEVLWSTMRRTIFLSAWSATGCVWSRGVVLGQETL
jgi:flagellar biosynthesis protein FlhB